MLPGTKFMMEPIVNYGVYVNFTMEGIYDGAHSRLCYVNLPRTKFMKKPIVNYGIYDETHSRLCYS